MVILHISTSAVFLRLLSISFEISKLAGFQPES